MPIGRRLTSRARLSPPGTAERGLTAAGPEATCARAGRRGPPRSSTLARARSRKPSRVMHLRREPGPDVPTVYLSKQTVNERGGYDGWTPAALAPHGLVPRSARRPRRGVGDELATLQRGPKRLNSLRNHATREAGHRHLQSMAVLRRPREPKGPLPGHDATSPLLEPACRPMVSRDTRPRGSPGVCRAGAGYPRARRLRRRRRWAWRTRNCHGRANGRAARFGFGECGA